MKIDQKILTEDDIEFKNRMQLYKLKCLLKKAEQINKDEKKEQRLEGSHCLLCYYDVMGGLACQAFTDTNCSICNTTMTFSNSNVDMVCLPCAKEKELCIKCGANLDYREETLVPMNKTRRKSC